MSHLQEDAAALEDSLAVAPCSPRTRAAMTTAIAVLPAMGSLKCVYTLQ